MTNFVAQRPMFSQLLQVPQQQTVGDGLTASMINLFAETFLPLLSQWLLQYKGVNVNPQEMMAIFNLPSMPQLQQRSTYGILNQANRSTLKGKDVLGHGECSYRYVKGAQQGKFCGRPCAEGSDLCTSCLKKRGPKEGTVITSTSGSLTQPAISVINGMVATATMLGNQASRPTMTNTCEQVKWYSKGIRDPKENFLIVIPPTGKPVAFCHYDGINMPRALTADEARTAIARGYTVLPADSPKVEAKLKEVVQCWMRSEEDKGRKHEETIQPQADQLTKLQEKLSRTQGSITSLSLKFDKPKQLSPEERLEALLREHYSPEDAQTIRERKVGTAKIRELYSVDKDPKFAELLEVMISLSFPEEPDSDELDDAE